MLGLNGCKATETIVKARPLPGECMDRLLSAHEKLLAQSRGLRADAMLARAEFHSVVQVSRQTRCDLNSVRSADEEDPEGEVPPKFSTDE